MKILALFVALMLTRVVQAEISFEESCRWNDQSNAKIVKKLFTQKRFIKGLTVPIETEGDFTLYQNDKIEWVTKKPFYSEVVISKRGISVSSDKGKSKVENFDGEFFKELGEVLVALHATNGHLKSLEMLKSKFEINCSETTSGKKLMRAIPRDLRIGRIIGSMEISGEKEPSKIVVVDSRGDITEVILK